MAEEQKNADTYLTALKGSATSQAGSAPARARDPRLVEHSDSMVTGSSTGTPSLFPGGEKRRSPRYKCQGSADMREEAFDVRTWATFTDISLHGCYVEAQATYPVGTVLHLKLEANGVKVEVDGTVRVSYPYLGMGIAFTDIQQETQARLKEMLNSISGPTVAAERQRVSPNPTSGPQGAALMIANPMPALHELIEFFEDNQMMTRDDFLRILRMSQD
jgi:hypothetical protein